MKHYDLTGAKVIEALETPWVYCNDNMTEEEKRLAMHEYLSDLYDDTIHGDLAFTLFPTPEKRRAEWVVVK